MQESPYKRSCPSCGRTILYISLDSFRHVLPTSKCRYCCNVLRGRSSNRKGCHHTDASKQMMSVARQGKKLPLTTRLKMQGRKVSTATRLKMSAFQKKRYSNPAELRKMASAVKIAMHRPDVREKHLAALAKTRWLKVKADLGQLELLEKWNGLGFEFKPNYQVHNGSNLFYIDGYDKEHNVVLEYDSKYHHSLGQQEKDLIRQNKIIDILKPKRFWRYDAINKQLVNVLDGTK